MIIISDTSPISGLFLVGKLSLLPDIFGKVIIPPAVMAELEHLERAGHDISEIENADWLEVASPNDSQWVARLLTTLDAGESEAIVLAKELKANYLIMDDLDGRKVAASVGIPVIGLLGVLALAKRAGLIPKVKPLMEVIILKTKFRISAAVLQKALSDIGE
jgi:predicted nucleic acid-binding protein